ncbi:MAG TPA: hypothetical protein VHE09_01225 [Rhizomicrobium sp.]|nr:hypothetical protein [Rhizomicrobium sp.]
MKMTSVLLGTAALVASTGLAFAGHQHANPMAAHKAKIVHHELKGVNRSLTVLYNQQGTDSGIGIDSQNFESSFAAYDDAAADDFTTSGTWKVKEIDVVGQYYNGYGPAESEDVTIYTSKHGHPNNVWAQALGVVGSDDGFGSFAIKAKLKKLKPGKQYWVSVVANCPFFSCGQWAWENQTTQVGDPAQWQNPGGGFGVCPTWDDENVCIPDGQGDHMFTLRGASL